MSWFYLVVLIGCKTGTTSLPDIRIFGPISNTYELALKKAEEKLQIGSHLNCKKMEMKVWGEKR